MEDKCGAQPREGNGHSMQINPTIFSGNTKCNKYKYNNYPRKYEMQKIQIQQPSGEIQNATNTNTTTIRGNTKCNKYKYNNNGGKYKMQQIQIQTIIRGNTTTGVQSSGRRENQILFFCIHALECICRDQIYRV